MPTPRARKASFYVWSKADIVAVLGEGDAARFAAAYDVTEGGNWEGHNILNRLHNPMLGLPADEKALREMRGKLLAHRGRRIRPGWDDKVLADWNGLMIGALVHAARVMDRPEWLTAAARAFHFVLQGMEESGRLNHCYRAGQRKALATASDYANMIWAALRLFEATNEGAFLTAAERWCAALDRHHWVEMPAAMPSPPTIRPTSSCACAARSDDATPNANAMMVSNLVVLFLLTGKPAFLERAHAIPQAFAADLARTAVGHCGLMAACFDLLAPQHVVVIKTGGDAQAERLARAPLRLSLPGAVQQTVAADQVPRVGALADKSALEGKSTAFACLGPQCSLPVTERRAAAGPVAPPALGGRCNVIHNGLRPEWKYHWAAAVVHRPGPAARPTRAPPGHRLGGILDVFVRLYCVPGCRAFS